MRKYSYKSTLTQLIIYLLIHMQFLKIESICRKLFQMRRRSQLSRSSTNREDNTKKFVSDLDMLLIKEDSYLYAKIDKEKVQEAIENFAIIDDEGNNYSLFSSVQKFQKFAPGVYLMFKLLKHLMLMFFVIGVISIIQLLILLKSPFYTGYENIVRINMLRLTIASLQLEDYIIYIVLDACILLVASGFLIWWNEKLRGFANKCNESNKLPSYLTVQLTNVSNTFSEQSLEQYLINHEGITPHEIYTGRNYGKFLKHYKKLTQTAIDLRARLELYANEEEQVKKKEAKGIIEKFLDLKNQYCSIKSYKFNEKKYKPKEVFIVLKSYHERQALVRNSRSIVNLCSSKRAQNRQQNEYRFKPCQIEPEAIAWQNIGISYANYMTRAIIVFVVLCVFTCLGVIVIFMLEILETASIGDAYHFHEQNLSNLASGFDSHSQEDNNCIGWAKNQPCHGVVNYAKLALLILITPFTIFVCKKLIMTLLSHFVNFRKYPSEVSRIKSQIITLSTFYFVVIAGLHLFLYLKTKNSKGEQIISLYELLYPFTIKLFKITNYNPVSIHLYSDYSLDWYKEATFFIVIICSTSFNISNGFKFIVNFISFRLQKRKTLKQNTIYGLKKQLRGIDLHTEHIYASMIVITYFGFLYGCPIPITVCFCFVNLIFLFYTTKWTFINYGSRPLRIGHSINRTVTNLLFLGLIIHCVFAPIFLCAEGIGKNNAHYKYNIQHPEEEAFKNESLAIVERYQKLGPFYLTVATLLALYVVFRKAFKIYIVEKIKKKFQNSKQSSSICKELDHFGLYPSYSMHYNAQFGPILRNIYLLNRIEAKRMTCPMPSSLKKFQDSINEQDKAHSFLKQIITINNEYLDKRKYDKMYNEVNNLARLLNGSELQIENANFQRATNDRIKLDPLMIDGVRQEVEED